MNPEPCPRCDGSVTIVGRIYHDDPEDIIEIKGCFVRFQAPVRACLGCGLCWTAVDPIAQRAQIAQRAGPLIRQYVDRLAHGAPGDLPDTDQGRRVAANVAEIDDLILRGRPHVAVRRFRELTGQTWDQARSATNKWRDLARDEKLARFGWEGKKAPADDLAEWP